MPNTSEAYRQQAIIDYHNQLNAKLAAQHTQRDGEVPINGNADSFNMGDILISNIMESRYFFQVLDIMDFEGIIDEIKKEVHDLEPLIVGSSRHPSSAFCILYKLARMRINFQELNWMIHTMDSPIVRGLGFLYIRFAMNPRDLWKFYAPYFDDDMRIVPYGDRIPMTIGKYVLSLIENKRYQNVVLPMIPITVKREWDVNIMKLQALDNRQVKPGIIHSGDSIMGFYGVDLMWYPAKVVKVNSPNSIYVVYDTYGNKEIRTRGHVLIDGEDPLDIKAKSPEPDVTRSSRSPSIHSSRSHRRSRSRSHHHSESHRHRSRSSSHRHHSRSSSRDSHSPGRIDDINDMFDDKKLSEIAREKERRAAVANGRVAQNVGHVKQCLMLKMDTFTARKRSYSPERNVVINKLDAEDSLEKAREDREREEREEENRKRLETIKNMYTKDKSEEMYNRDYV